MTYNVARALTASELAIIRKDGQFTKIRAVVVPQQPIIYLQCSGSLANNDAVSSVTVTVVSGSAARVMNGMTGYVGTAPGLSDVGMVRVKSLTGSVLKIGRVSGIRWSSSLYITIVDDFGLWGKLPTLEIDSIKMNDDVKYTSQNSATSPMPIMGPDTAVPYSSGSIALDGSNSYCIDGSSITNYLWSYTNGSSAATTLSSGSAAGTSFVFPSAGSFILHLTVTSSKGVSTTGHRNIYVYNDSTYKPLDQLNIDTLSASRDDGGWNAEVTLWAGGESPGVRDRAKVILIAQDVFSGSSVSIGQVIGSEHVLMVGWIAGESIEYNKNESTVKFDVQGAHWWLQQITGPSTFLENVESTPKAWTSFQNLTMDKVFYHFMYWRSTAAEVLDVYRCSNSRIIGGMSCSIGNIWEQCQDTALSRMLTYMAVDRYGRFLPYIDPQVLPLASRSSIPVVQVISDEDVTEKVQIKRQVVNPVSLLEVAGLATSGTDVQMYMSRAPGSLIYGRYGENDTNDRLVVSSQSDANNLSGMLLAKKNNPYPDTNITLGQINHMIDIAPAMYIELSTTAVQNARGISYTNMNFLPLEIDYRLSEDTNAVTVDISAEGATSGSAGYTVTMPQEPIYNLPQEPDISMPSFAFTPSSFGYNDNMFSAIMVYPGSSGSPCRDETYAEPTGPVTLSVGKTLKSNSRTSLKLPFRTYLRPSSATNPSSYTISANWLKLNDSFSMGPVSGSAITYDYTLTDDWYSIYALDVYGNRVALGVHDAVINPYLRTGKFNNAAGVDIYGIEIIINSPELLTVMKYNPKFSPGNNTCCGSYGNAFESNCIWYYEDDHVHSHGAGWLENSYDLFGWYSYCAACVYVAGFTAGSVNQWLIKLTGFVNASYDPSAECVQIGYFRQPLSAWLDLHTVQGNKLPDEGLYYKFSNTNNLNYMGARIYGGPSGALHHTNLLAYFDIENVPTYMIDISSFSLWNICSNSEDE